MAIGPGEQKTLNFLSTLYEEGSRHRANHSSSWDRAIKTIKGEVWPERRPKYKLNAIMNFLSQIVERKAALITDSRPSISVQSRKMEQDPLCSILEKVISAILDEKNFEQRLTEFVMLEEHFGFALFNTCWDQSLDYGRGDIDLVVVDPRTFIFDPFVRRSWNLQHGEYCCLEAIRPTEYLIQKYGRPEDIKPDITTVASGKDSFTTKLRTFFGWDQQAASQPASVIPRSIVRDWWIRDRWTKKGDSLMFPNWRHLIIAGGCIVEDGANPYIDGNHSFDGMEWGFNVDSAYGRNEVDLLESPQILFNKLLASVMENAIMMGNSIWVGDRDALLKDEWKNLINEPGSVIQKKRGTDLHRESPPPLPAYLLGFGEMLVNGIEKLSGVTEVTEGRRPGQVTSGVAIESLAIMAQTTLRLKARQLESLIQRIGQKLISRIFAYYTTDRVFNLIDDKGHPEYFTFQRKEIEKAIKERGITFQDYIFKVVPTSSLAMTKWQKGLMATQLYQLGLIDEEAALDALEFPNRDLIMKRMSEKQAQQAELMTAIQQQGGNGGGGFGRKTAPQKMSRNLLRGSPHKETGLQYPQT